jgi:hypothetical protein
VWSAGCLTSSKKYNKDKSLSLNNPAWSVVNLWIAHRLSTICASDRATDPQRSQQFPLKIEDFAMQSNANRADARPQVRYC